MSPTVYEIDLDTGLIEFVGSPEAMLDAPVISKRRVSHVEPVNVVYRVAFHVLRKLFGEDGRVGNWTRRWSVNWRARMLVGDKPVLGTFRDRAVAIAAEIEWLRQKGWE